MATGNSCGHEVHTEADVAIVVDVEQLVTRNISGELAGVE
jgi:hypothetical protein